MNTPTSPLIGFAGFLVAVGVFVGLAAIVGGVAVGDASVGIYATWAIEHGRLVCAYPPAVHLREIPSIARPWTTETPFYPIISGVAAAIFRIGHATPFPTSAQLGANCLHGYTTMFRWSVRSNAATSTLRVGYLSGVVLLGGVATYLRAARRGWHRGSLLALIVVASLAPVLGSIVQYFHPQDLVAMGLILAGGAGVLRGRWVVAGVFIGLAIVTQQFALLPALAFVVVLPAKARWRFFVAAAVAVLVVDLPFLVATSGRAFHAVVIGTGFSPSLGGTVLWELGLHGPALFVAARVAPIVATGCIAWWVRHHFGDEVLSPVVLTSLIGVSLTMRLVFEVNLWPYYFMALAVSMVVLEAVRGRVRSSVVAWLITVTLAFDPLPGIFQSNAKISDIYLRLDLSEVIVGAFALYVVVSFLRQRHRWFWLIWTVAAAAAFVHVPVIDVLARYVWRTWLWQVLLVPSGLALVAAPGYRMWSSHPNGVDQSLDVVGANAEVVGDDGTSRIP